MPVELNDVDRLVVEVCLKPEERVKMFGMFLGIKEDEKSEL
jgi:hypothetical protein